MTNIYQYLTNLIQTTNKPPLIIFILLLISSCGFHLRGTNSVNNLDNPQNLAVTLQFADPHHQLAAQLINELNLAQITIEPHAEHTLKLDKPIITTQTNLLKVSINVVILNNDNELILDEIITSNRVDNVQVDGNNDNLLNNMFAEISQDIIRKLRTILSDENQQKLDSIANKNRQNSLTPELNSVETITDTEITPTTEPTTQQNLMINTDLEK